MKTSISGFPSYSLQESRAFWALQQDLYDLYKQFGYPPIFTPSFENLEALRGNGDDKEIFEFEENGLRFDLTVPLVTYINLHSLPMPFRRAQIAPVWRGERAQKHRFREFYQADVDYVAKASINIHNVHEILNIITQALPIVGKHVHIPTVHLEISSRVLMQELLKVHGTPNVTAAVLMVVDKSAKHKDPDAYITQQLSTLGTKCLDDLLKFVNSEVLKPSEVYETVMQEILTLAYTHGLTFNPRMARGLAYYTDFVFEGYLAGNESAVLGGGVYTKDGFNGVGCSLGLTRILSVCPLREPSKDAVFVMLKDKSENALAFAHLQANNLRREGCPSVIVSDRGTPYSDQMRLAEQLNCSHVIFPDGTDKYLKYGDKNKP